MHDARLTGTPAVIFDLDGTLADTLDDITASVNVAIAEVGLGPVDCGRVRACVGDGLPALIARVVVGADEATQARVMATFRAHYRRHLLDSTRLYDGIADVLDRLASESCPMAVLSNKPDDATRTICATLLARWPFVACWGAAPSRPNKPDASAALALAARLARAPQDVVFVGDTAVDVTTAANAGMPAVGVTWGFRARSDLVAAGANVVIDRPAELVGAILRRP